MVRSTLNNKINCVNRINIFCPIFQQPASQSQVAKPRQRLRNVLTALVGTHARHRKSNAGRTRKKRPDLLQRRELCLVHVGRHGSDDRSLHPASDLLLLGNSRLRSDSYHVEQN